MECEIIVRNADVNLKIISFYSRAVGGGIQLNVALQSAKKCKEEEDWLRQTSSSFVKRESVKDGGRGTQASRRRNTEEIGQSW